MKYWINANNMHQKQYKQVHKIYRITKLIQMQINVEKMCNPIPHYPSKTHLNRNK